MNKLFISLMCKLAYEDVKLFTKHEMDYCRDAYYYLKDCKNIDYIDHHKLLIINIGKTFEPFLKNKYKSDDPLANAFYTPEVLKNILPVRYLMVRGGFPHHRSYFGNIKAIQQLLPRVYKIHKVTAIDLPQRRYIGVGYRDKGHRRNIAIDGSPGWLDIYPSFNRSTPRHERFYNWDFLQVCYEVRENTKIEGLPYDKFLDMLELEEEETIEFQSNWS